MVSHNTTVEFAGEEFKKSLDNLQSILDAAKPLAVKLVPSEQLKASIAECIKTVQVLLSQAVNKHEEWQDKTEKQGTNNLSQSQKRQQRIQVLRRKENKTQEEEEELTELQNEQGM